VLLQDLEHASTPASPLTWALYVRRIASPPALTLARLERDCASARRVLEKLQLPASHVHPELASLEFMMRLLRVLPTPQVQAAPDPRIVFILPSLTSSVQCVSCLESLRQRLATE
jgi:hypothetical protein